MSDQPTGTIPPVTPVTSLEDPRVVSILSTEHWNLLSNRSLAYNEALTRGGMFLTSLSMSFVALALLAQALGFSDQFLIVAALVLAFDLVIGLTTYGRILGANLDDLRAVHGMARIRQAYVRIAPAIVPFLTSPSNDDPRSVMRVYGDSPSTFPATLFYALTTSGGMIGLITSIVGGVLAAVLALLAGLTNEFVVLLVGLGGAVVVFLALVGVTMRYVPRVQGRMVVAFPAQSEHADRLPSTPDEPPV
jgi:hypothetical protein